MGSRTDLTDAQVIIPASRGRALYLTGAACVLLIADIVLLAKVIVPAAMNSQHVSDEPLVVGFLAVGCLMSLYLIAMYANWAFRGIPVLVLTRDELRIRALPWHQRTVRWDDISRLEMRVRATLGWPTPLYGRRRPAWLYITLRPEARRVYHGKKRLRLIVPMYLISQEINEVADALNQFFPVERVVLPL